MTVGCVPTSFLAAMEEVKDKLIEHNYWEVSARDFEAEVIGELKQALIAKGYWPDHRE